MRIPRKARFSGPWRPFARRLAAAAALPILALAWGPAGLRAQPQPEPPPNPLDALVSAVVQIRTFIAPDGRSVANLGRERQGSGILIDEAGLVLTIGYLMLEAHAAEVVTGAGRTVPASVVGYDHDTGFGLLRTVEPLKLKPLPLGRSADLKEADRALAVSFGGVAAVLPVEVVSKREFAGSWEYLLPEAIFTAPPHPLWSGAALVSREGKLVGVGSLIVGDARGKDGPSPGNMFVPIDALLPILGDLLADGRVSGAAKPWLGVNASEAGGRLVVGRVTPESPAEKAGLRRGDVIVGVGGEPAGTLSEFYRAMWSRGAAGIVVPLDVIQGGESRRIDVPSANRLDHLKLKSTF